jgi:hypothetical protein
MDTLDTARHGPAQAHPDPVRAAVREAERAYARAARALDHVTYRLMEAAEALHRARRVDTPHSWYWQTAALDVLQELVARAQDRIDRVIAAFDDLNSPAVWELALGPSRRKGRGQR